MKIINEHLAIDTKGDPDLIDITREITDILKKSGLKKGSLTVFVTGSTAAITTFENGKPLLGTWQQVVLVECDTRPRDRTVVVTVMGE